MPKAGVEASLTSVCAWRAARYRKPSAVWDRTLPIMAHIVLLMTSCQIILNLRWLQTGQGDLWKYQIPCHHICRSILRGNAASTWKKQRSEEHTSELQSRQYLVCRLLLEKKKTNSNLR